MIRRAIKDVEPFEVVHEFHAFSLKRKRKRKQKYDMTRYMDRIVWPDPMCVSRQKFSKVHVISRFLYKETVGTTFENVYLAAFANDARSV